MHVQTLILGAGLTGLSTAYHLEALGRTDYLLAERAAQPGGLCASRVVRGFTFDYSGHLLHLHTEYGLQLVRKLLRGNLQRLKRQAWVYTGSARIPFPIQANLFALPPAQRDACVAGLLAARGKTGIPHNFEQWCRQSFGDGLYDLFFRPYNTKLWGRPPRDLTCDWCGPFVPLPTEEEILQSACRPPRKAYGYNAFFYYPKQGGCGALAQALARGLTGLRTRTAVTQVDLKRKTAVLNGREVRFERVVNTLPLPVFLQMLAGEPRLQALAGQLTAAPVNVYNLAVRKQAEPFSWIYFPDETDPFYRVGQQSAFAASNAPQGTCSFYMELPGTAPRTVRTEKRILSALLQKGIIDVHDEVLFSFWQTLPYAYAVYDQRRSRAVRQALQALAKRGCFCAGRYGRWEYSFMEASLLAGLDLAEKLV